MRPKEKVLWNTYCCQCLHRDWKPHTSHEVWIKVSLFVFFGPLAQTMPVVYGIGEKIELRIPPDNQDVMVPSLVKRRIENVCDRCFYRDQFSLGAIQLCAERIEVVLIDPIQDAWRIIVSKPVWFCFRFDDVTRNSTICGV